MVKDENDLPEKATLEQLKNWCAFQERCQREVKEKIHQLRPDIPLGESASIIATLIAENYINEERYALAYAGGKFRIKKWGKIKIRVMLKQKQISDYSIKKALNSIDEIVYENTLEKIIADKHKMLKSEKNKIRLHYKLLRFAQSRGFETDLILNILREEKS